MTISGHMLRLMSSGSQAPPKIGDSFGGGFYIGTFDGYMHIIADKASETTRAWGPFGNAVGASSNTDSKTNTDLMFNFNPRCPSAEYCRNYRGGGLSDWDLPAKDVLNLVWVSLAPGGGGTPAAFQAGGAQAMDTANDYWTSTEVSDVAALFQRFSTGLQQAYNKSGPLIIRPVRRIKL